MTPEATDDEPRLLSYRVGELEKVVDRQGRDTAVRLERIEGQLTGLTVLAQMERRLDDRITAVAADVDKRFLQTDRDAGRNWTAFIWVMGILLTLVLGALTRLGGVFG